MTWDESMPGLMILRATLRRTGFSCSDGFFLLGQAGQGIGKEKPALLVRPRRGLGIQFDTWQQAFAACRFDEDAAHGLGRGGEEMAAAVPVPLGFGVHQPQVGLVNQGGRLEGLAGLLLGHLRGGQLAQLVVDQWQELRGGVRVALLHRGQDAGNLGHGRLRSAGEPGGGILADVLPGVREPLRAAGASPVEPQAVFPPRRPPVSIPSAWPHCLDFFRHPAGHRAVTGPTLQRRRAAPHAPVRPAPTTTSSCCCPCGRRG
jgi:hypothetical protein